MYMVIIASTYILIYIYVCVYICTQKQLQPTRVRASFVEDIFFAVDSVLLYCIINGSSRPPPLTIACVYTYKKYALIPHMPRCTRRRRKKQLGQLDSHFLSL